MLLGLALMLLVSVIGPVMVGQGETSFWGIIWRLLLLVGVGLIAVVGFQSHLSVCASFVAARWSAQVTQPVRVSPLWPASWV